MNKEIRKRLKPMNSLINIFAIEKIVYLHTITSTQGDNDIKARGDLPLRGSVIRLLQLTFFVGETITVNDVSVYQASHVDGKRNANLLRVRIRRVTRRSVAGPCPPGLDQYVLLL